jgi:hypothetical protein
MPEEDGLEETGLAVRIADADRERVAVALREHCVEGRLTLEEFSTRLDEAYAARTRAELDEAKRELPAEAAPATRPKRRSWLVTLIGSEQRRGPWRVARRLFAFSLLGAPDLDFRRAVVTTDEIRITSISLIGSLTAIVPSGVEVELGGFSLIGGNDFVARGEARHVPGGPRISIRCYSLIGGAGVMHVSGDEALGPRDVVRAIRRA